MGHKRADSISPFMPYFDHAWQLRSALHAAKAEPIHLRPVTNWKGRVGFLPGTGHADDDGLAPATVRTFQRCTHHLHIANAFKRMIHPSRSSPQSLAEWACRGPWVHKVSGTKVAANSNLAGWCQSNVDATGLRLLAPCTTAKPMPPRPSTATVSPTPWRCSWRRQAPWSHHSPAGTRAQGWHRG